jgi:hypothetical protein
MVAGGYLGHRRAHRNQRLDLGGDMESATLSRPVEGLDPDGIPGQVHPPTRSLHHGKGELAPEVMDGVLAPFQECLQHHFGVAGAAQLVAQTLELGAELPVVEDLAVVTQGPLPVGRGPGLHGAVPVHDLQSLGPEQEAVLAQCLLHVAPGGDGHQHLVEQGAVRAVTKDESDAAHRPQPPNAVA